MTLVRTLLLTGFALAGECDWFITARGIFPSAFCGVGVVVQTFDWFLLISVALATVSVTCAIILCN